MPHSIFCVANSSFHFGSTFQQSSTNIKSLRRYLSSRSFISSRTLGTLLVLQRGVTSMKFPSHDLILPAKGQQEQKLQLPTHPLLWYKLLQLGHNPKLAA